MSYKSNTSYKVQVDVDSDATRDQYKVEEGAYVTTPTGVYTVWNDGWRKLYPQGGASSGLGWCRYDDSTYDVDNKLALSNGVEVLLPNDGASAYRSHSSVDYYADGKVLAEFENDTYMMTIVFKYSAPNANQTYLELVLEGGNGTPYDRIRDVVIFPKGNDTTHDYHGIFQYYADANFVNSGSEWKITSIGGSTTIWDIIFFIQKTQNYG
jgi:hypothetical protein